MAAQGLTLSPGEKAGEWLVLKDGKKIGSLRRLTRTRLKDFCLKIEELANGDAGDDAAIRGIVVIEKLDHLLEEIQTLREFANLLGQRMPDGHSFRDRVQHLLSLLVEGNEVTHGSIQALHASLTDSRFQASMPEAFRGD